VLKITHLHQKAVIRELIEKLKEKAKTAILVVEGKQDAEALAPLVNADFFLLQDASKSLFEVAEYLAASNKEILLLLDADKKGKELTKKLASLLRQHGASVDANFGLKLLKIARRRTIQGLKRIIKQLSDEKWN